MKHSTTEATKATTPVTQVSERLPRHAAIQNLPHRWMTKKAMNASTLHMWRLLAKWPTGLVCHQSGPPMAMTMPERMTSPSVAMLATPKT